MPLSFPVLFDIVNSLGRIGVPADPISRQGRRPIAGIVPRNFFIDRNPAVETMA